MPCSSISAISGADARPGRAAVPVRWLLAGAASLAILLANPAGAWQGALEGGGRLWVDPDSRRALRDDGDRPRPLWDGVHRLDDGSTVIVRDGIVVPTREMLEAWGAGPDPLSVTGDGPCAALVVWVCGDRDECADTSACFQSRRWLNAERAEQRLTPYEAGRRPDTATSAVCRAAFGDTVGFPACASAEAHGDAGLDACASLVARVCGDANQCADSLACDPARQLLGWRRDAARGGERQAVREIEDQCAEAATNPFFAPCE